MMACACRQWHRNQDNELVTADAVYIVRDPQLCPNKANSWPLVPSGLTMSSMAAPAPAGTHFALPCPALPCPAPPCTNTLKEPCLHACPHACIQLRYIPLSWVQGTASLPSQSVGSVWKLLVLSAQWGLMLFVCLQVLWQQAYLLLVDHIPAQTMYSNVMCPLLLVARHCRLSAAQDTADLAYLKT